MKKYQSDCIWEFLPLQQILGHESIATTQIYTHVSTEQLERAVNSNPLATMFGT